MPEIFAGRTLTNRPLLVKPVCHHVWFHQEAAMANRIRPLDEKVQPVRIALQQINVEAAARQAEVPASTLRYDLRKVEAALPEVLANQPPGPKPRDLVRMVSNLSRPVAASRVCPECGGKVRKNGTYQVLNWLLMLTMGWLGIQTVCIQRRRCKAWMTCCP
jgi:hypothetical protein